MFPVREMGLEPRHLKDSWRESRLAASNCLPFHDKVASPSN